jgi:2-oxoglutarate dehydrogenase E2 component (dihydrolipoamide succinyltransferase)
MFNLFIEVDVTNIVKERKNKKCSKRERRREVNLHPIFAVAKALKDFPGLNISVDGDYIIKKEKIHFMAASFNGNLIVPVLKNADQLNLVGMAKAVNDLGGRAKAGKLRPNYALAECRGRLHLCQLSHGH